MGYGHNFKDLTGQTFGCLTVIGINVNIIKRVNWECLCKCGTRCNVYSHKLLSGRTKSCGCQQGLGRGVSDISGEKFNLLTALHISKRIDKKTWWECVCECGNHTNVLISNLRNGSVKSCGCLSKGNNTKHGLSHTRLAFIFDNMKSRCYRINNKAYKSYGGRGISICAEWLQDNAAFYKWALENGYTDALTIERNNVNENYTPDNCMWATPLEQARNKRNTLGVDKVKEIRQMINEHTPLKDIANLYNVSPTTISKIRMGHHYKGV